MKRGVKTFLIWGLLAGVVFLALFRRSSDQTASVVSNEECRELLDAGEIRTYRADGERLVLVTVDGEAITPELHDPALWARAVESHIPFEPSSDASDAMFPISLLLFVLVGALVAFYFLRRARGGLNNIFELRKTKARAVESSDKARFTDVGGNRHAVELMGDIVDFLRAPERWTSAGLRIPRGILVIGPPGTGKTLLARAVAGETESNFFYTSATEFVEMFVGIGAARVRDTFEKALAKQPAVIFIDELDAIGRRRGSGSGTIHEEREQTLNQLLVALDGLEQHKRVVLIAATNRADVLDPALLRPGRFDRVLRLELPTAIERLDILKIHTRNKPLDAHVVLDRIVEQTDGFSGADLEALTNSAGMMAVRRSRAGADGAPSAISITADDFDRAREELTRSNRLFDRLDTVLVESVSQFAEPVGRAIARVTLAEGNVIEGEVQWMNSSHIKLRTGDGSDVILAKDSALQITSLKGTELGTGADFTPDRWAGKGLDVG